MSLEDQSGPCKWVHVTVIILQDCQMRPSAWHTDALVSFLDVKEGQMQRFVWSGANTLLSSPIWGHLVSSPSTRQTKIKYLQCQEAVKAFPLEMKKHRKLRLGG